MVLTKEYQNHSLNVYCHFVDKISLTLAWARWRPVMFFVYLSVCLVFVVCVGYGTLFRLEFGDFDGQDIISMP
jgi:hypothetical protein